MSCDTGPMEALPLMEIAGRRGKRSDFVPELERIEEEGAKEDSTLPVSECGALKQGRVAEEELPPSNRSCLEMEEPEVVVTVSSMGTEGKDDMADDATVPVSNCATVKQGREQEDEVDLEDNEEEGNEAVQDDRPVMYYDDSLPNPYHDGLYGITPVNAVINTKI